MFTSTRTVRGKAVLACAAVFLASACTAAPAPAPASPAATPPSTPGDSRATSPTPAASPSAAASTSPATSRSPSSAPSPPASSTAVDVVPLRITVRDGQVSPNGEKIRVRRGQTVALEVTSDAEDEVHAHTGDDDFTLAIRPGKPARGQFVAAESGTFEVELHELDKIAAILIVR